MRAHLDLPTADTAARVAIYPARLAGASIAAAGRWPRDRVGTVSDTRARSGHSWRPDRAAQTPVAPSKSRSLTGWAPLFAHTWRSTARSTCETQRLSR